uniref:J domain-containing protein n=1 Tax=Rhizophagus irregularis (strain DAOM 181602 / DAOM 197198 / MUCL 43194) TaxID=747089 RepID=U9TIC9_RHIID
MNTEENDLDLYELLGVNYNSTKEEIDKAYRRKAIKFHPDKNRDNVEAATKFFHQISAAYKTLTDPQKKLEYDKIHKAKIESKKRFEKLDAKRKALKEGNWICYIMLIVIYLVTYINLLLKNLKKERKP